MEDLLSEHETTSFLRSLQDFTLERLSPPLCNGRLFVSKSLSNIVRTLCFVMKSSIPMHACKHALAFSQTPYLWKDCKFFPLLVYQKFFPLPKTLDLKGCDIALFICHLWCLVTCNLFTCLVFLSTTLTRSHNDTTIYVQLLSYIVNEPCLQYNGIPSHNATELI